MSPSCVELSSPGDRGFDSGTHLPTNIRHHKRTILFGTRVTCQQYGNNWPAEHTMRANENVENLATSTGKQGTGDEGREKIRQDGNLVAGERYTKGIFTRGKKKKQQQQIYSQRRDRKNP